MITGKCKLCGKDNIDLCDSHIIPEFAYEPVYDSKHRFIDFSEDPKTCAHFEQKGIMEYLLCNGCETLLSKYENDLSGFIYNYNVTKNDVYPFSEFYSIITNIKYDSVKLAILSIIYRLAVSKFPQYDGYQLDSY